MPDATHSQHLDECSFPDVPKMQTVTPLKSQKTVVIETVGKAVPATFLFLSYMEPLYTVSRGKTGEVGPGRGIIGTTQGQGV
jgi:hypothetical protein